MTDTKADDNIHLMFARTYKLPQASLVRSMDVLVPVGSCKRASRPLSRDSGQAGDEGVALGRAYDPRLGQRTRVRLASTDVLCGVYPCRRDVIP